VFIVCVVLCAVFRLIVVLFCVLCFIVVRLPPAENPFAIKINNNNSEFLFIVGHRILWHVLIDDMQVVCFFETIEECSLPRED
jgi:hypothetical protein